MKIQFTVKTPDLLENALDGADLTEEEREECKAVAEQFIEYGEYVYLTLDTDKHTMVVKRV